MGSGQQGHLYIIHTIPSAPRIGRWRSRPCAGHIVSAAGRRCSRGPLRRLATGPSELAVHGVDESARRSAAQTSISSTSTLQYHSLHTADNAYSARTCVTVAGTKEDGLLATLLFSRLAQHGR